MLARALAGACAAAMLAAPAGVQAAAPAHWNAVAGDQGSSAIQVTQFLPDSLTVDVGDTITWTVNSGEFHTVTFLSGGPRPDLVIPAPGGGIQFNPVVAAPTAPPPGGYQGSGYVNSGLLFQGQTLSLQFGKAGTYQFVCLVHSGMTGTIQVQQSGAPYPHDQPFYDAQALAGKARFVGEGFGLSGAGLAAAISAGRNQETAGIGDPRVFVASFLPQRLVVRAGQTVTWTNRDPETPHTVTFGTEPPGGPLGAFAPAGVDGPSHATIGSPGQSVNSGFVGNGFPFGTTFNVTFTAPGTYSYFCSLHDDLGMTGTIQVLPAG